MINIGKIRGVPDSTGPYGRGLGVGGGRADGSGLMETKPFAGYSSFKDCVSKNQKKRDPEAYCADIMRKVEGKENTIPKLYEFYTTFSGFKEIETKAGKEYYVDGYISTSDRDLGNDIVTDKCLDDMMLQLAGRNIKTDFGHELGQGSSNPPTGRIVEYRREPKRIWINVLLNKNYPNFQGLLEQIRQKFIDGFSITYKAIDFVHKIVDGVKARLLNKVYLVNVGMTGNPMNTGCGMGDVVMKSINDFERDEKARTVDFKKEKTLEVTTMDEKKDNPEVKDSAKIEEAGKGTPEVKTNGTETKTVSAEQVGALETQVKKLTEIIESKQKEEQTINTTLDDIQEKILEQKEFEGIKAEKETEAQQKTNQETAEKLDKLYKLIHEPQLKALQSQEADLQKLRDLEAKAILTAGGKGGEGQEGQKDMSGPLDSIGMGGA